MKLKFQPAPGLIFIWSNWSRIRDFLGKTYRVRIWIWILFSELAWELVVSTSLGADRTAATPEAGDRGLQGCWSGRSNNMVNLVESLFTLVPVCVFFAVGIGCICSIKWNRYRQAIKAGAVTDVGPGGSQYPPLSQNMHDPVTGSRPSIDPFLSHDSNCSNVGTDN